MKIQNGCFALAGVVAFVIATAGAGWAQKAGGVLKIQHMDTPPSASIHEEATVSTAVPFMGLFNNLVMYDQHVARNSFESIVPDLATNWSWNDDGKQLAFLSNRNDEQQVYMMRADGGEPTALTKGKRSVQSFAWSPDGKQVSFLAPDAKTEAEEKKEKDKLEKAETISVSHRN